MSGSGQRCWEVAGPVRRDELKPEAQGWGGSGQAWSLDYGAISI